MQVQKKPQRMRWKNCRPEREDHARLFATGAGFGCRNADADGVVLYPLAGDACLTGVGGPPLAASVKSDSVYAFDGQHLGWWEHGWVRDQPRRAGWTRRWVRHKPPLESRGPAARLRSVARGPVVCSRSVVRRGRWCGSGHTRGPAARSRSARCAGSAARSGSAWCRERRDSPWRPSQRRDRGRPGANSWRNLARHHDRQAHLTNTDRCAPDRCAPDQPGLVPVDDELHQRRRCLLLNAGTPSGKLPGESPGPLPSCAY